MTTKKVRMGRPPLAVTMEQYVVRLLPEDREAFAIEAAKQGVGLSTWMRMVCRQALGRCYVQQTPKNPRPRAGVK